MGIEIQYLGVSAFKITFENGTKVLIDPCLSGYLGIGRSPVSVGEVCDADLILVTHGGADHLGDTMEILRVANCRLPFLPELRN